MNSHPRGPTHRPVRHLPAVHIHDHLDAARYHVEKAIAVQTQTNRLLEAAASAGGAWTTVAHFTRCSCLRCSRLPALSSLISTSPPYDKRDQDSIAIILTATIPLHKARPAVAYTAPQSPPMTTQIPMISVPLKQTQEIDWIAPLKQYIRATYGDDPERYSEECATLNRLRQDMRGAGKDSAAGRDLLYRYYGQLELLDLRFPVDENHIKISFTW